MSKSHFTPTLILVAITASLGGLLSGFDMGVISGALLFINKTWELSSLAQGWIVSSAIVGSIFGAGLNGFLSDIFGRKKIIIITSVIFIIGSLMCAYAASYQYLIISRMIIGFAVGMISFVTPLYLSEIAPKAIRGTLVSLYQLSLTFGILLSYLINRAFANFDYNWRLMLGFGAIPAIILFIGILFLHDTPRWLVSKNKLSEARLALSKIFSPFEIESQIIAIQDTLSASVSKDKHSISSWMFFPIFLGVGLMFVQICTGINTIIYYTPSIFKLAGFTSDISALYATIGVGLVNFLMTFIAIYSIDKFGRKPLLYLGLSGMLLSLFGLSASFAYSETHQWLAVVCVISYIAFFALSLGPVCWIMISEIMPLKIRGFAVSVATVSNFLFNFAVVLTFLPLLEYFGEVKVFASFGIITIASLAFVYYFVPETKGLSLEQIEKNWHNHVSPRKF